ncbi:unnamed protein product [Victoria cruziana]
MSCSAFKCQERIKKHILHLNCKCSLCNKTPINGSQGFHFSRKWVFTSNGGCSCLLVVVSLEGKKECFLIHHRSRGWNFL